MAFVPGPRSDLYISADIETDGPIPGEFSMLSFGLSLASRFDGQTFRAYEPDASTTFYVELKPVSDRFQDEALEVNGLDRDELVERGTDPERAMRDASAWVNEMAEGARPVLVAYPVAFDWAFLYWYFIKFTGESPFGYSSCLDIRTLFQARALTTFDRASKSSMPTRLLPRREHTHNAADDAQEQAELFNAIFLWALKGGGRGPATSNLSRHTPEWLAAKTNPHSRPVGPTVLDQVLKRTS